MTTNTTLERILDDNQKLISERKLTTEGLIIQLFPDTLSRKTADFLKLYRKLMPFNVKWLGTQKHAFWLPAETTELPENNSVDKTIKKLQQHFTPLPMSEAEIKEALTFLLNNGVGMREIAESTGASLATLYRISPKKPKEKLSSEKNMGAFEN